MAEDDTPTIHVLMSRVMADVGAIGKTGWNPQQNFAFRGIDAVMSNLHPALVKHGVFFVPEVIDRDRRDFTTKRGAEMEAVHLHVRFTFYGPRGDSVACSAWGESADAGDKATGKAMSMALKSALLQTFCVPTRDLEDADGTSVERGRAPDPEPPRPEVPTTPPGPLPAPADRPAPKRSKEEFRAAILAAETKQQCWHILRDVAEAGWAQEETTNAAGVTVSFNDLATAAAKGLAS